MSKRLSYTTIHHPGRKTLGLSITEYCVADMIHRYATNPDSRVIGWCYASKEAMAREFGLTKQTVHRLINSLIERGLVERDPETKYLKTTSTWFNNVILEEESQNVTTSNNLLPPVTKDDVGSNKMLPNNNIDNSKELLRNSAAKGGKVSCPNPKGHGSCGADIRSIETSFHKNFKANFAVQLDNYHRILKAGYTEAEIEHALNVIDEDPFYQDKGWDLRNVLQCLSKGGKYALRKA